MHPSPQVANRFLELADARGVSLTPMQLMKLVYLAHGWMLGLHGRPLINDQVQAWKYGPVIPTLYKQIREFRSDGVRGRLAVPSVLPFDDDEDDIIRQTFDTYGNKTAAYLSALTHRSGSPWAQVWDPDGWAVEIPDTIIQDYYATLAAA